MTNDGAQTADLADTSSTGIASGLTLVIAVACGLVVANIYYAQPLAGPIARSIGLPPAATGLIVTLTQIGYGIGLLLLVPLGDLLENRRLIVTMICATMAALIGAALSTTVATFLVAALAIGLCSTAVQMLVPFAASLAPASERGRVVGNVMSGLMLGIMMARPAASFIARVSSWHVVFFTSAAIMVAVAITLLRTLPKRTPSGNLTYPALLRSMINVIASQPVLRRRACYQICVFGVFSLFWTVTPLLLASPRFGLTQGGIALFALAGVTGAIASPIAGRLADRGLGKPAVFVGIASVVIGFGLTLVLQGGSGAALAVFVLAAIMIDFGATMCAVTGQRAIYALPAELRSRLNGLFGASAFMGGALGSALGGWAYAAGGWPAAAAIGIALPVGAFCYALTDKD